MSSRWTPSATSRLLSKNGRQNKEDASYIKPGQAKEFLHFYSSLFHYHFSL
jgi:hypothetical protein